MADPKKKTKSKWQASDEAYLITAWNDLQATGWTRKDAICGEISRRFNSNPQVPNRTVEQVRRKLERMLKDQDARLTDVCKIVLD